VPNTAAAPVRASASASTRAASAWTTTSASTNQSTSPFAISAPRLRAPPGPSRPPEGTTRAPAWAAIHADASVEPSSTTISSAISPSTANVASGARLRASTASPL